MRRVAGASLAVWLCGLTGCHLLQPRPDTIVDPFVRAEAARASGDLASALCAFDEVAPDDPRYAAARLQAAALEQRLRRHHELVLKGLRLRSEWRSDEALTVFGEALAAWPEDRCTAQLLAATEHRRVAVATPATARPSTDEANDLVQQASAMPVAEPVSSGPLGAAPLGESTSDAPRAFDPVGAQLARLEARLQRGQLDSVLAEMFSLHRQAPGDARVCGRLARLLMQRGLVHYGRGAVTTALDDWRRARKLDPQLQGLAQLIDAASRETVEAPR